jgi:hypothetical protein
VPNKTGVKQDALVMICFFALGTAIAALVALLLIDRGHGFMLSVGYGSFFGAFAAWVVFFAAARVLVWMRPKSRRS